MPMQGADPTQKSSASRSTPLLTSLLTPRVILTNFEMLHTSERETDHPSTSLAHQAGKDSHTRDPPSPRFDDDFDIFGHEMIPGTAASSPFVKDEPNEWNFNEAPTMNPEANQFGSMPINSFGGQIASGSVDPADLHGNAFTQFTFGNDNMTSSLIGDDELTSLDLSNAQKMQQQQQQQQQQPGMNGFFNNNNGNNTMQPPQQQQTQQQSQQQHQQHQQQQAAFNQAAQGEQATSPFMQAMHQTPSGSYPNQFHGQQQMSPFLGARPTAPPLSREASYMSRPRNSIAMERQASGQSPMTPRTPAMGMGNLHLGTPESGSMPMPVHRHQKSLSGQWDGPLVGSYDSIAGSPMASPAHVNHAKISEVLKSGSSLPAKADHPGYQTVEAKRRRRRESHNLVERRRRDNINERIQELAQLVPTHRLEDERVRKHLQANSPISPPGLGVSPPQVSLLAQKRSSAGSLALTLPSEERDKGPNKGEILNGSVAWTRDLVWYTHTKLQQEAQLRELVSSLGGTWPFSETDDERRMQSELTEVFEKLPVDSFDYSRANGTGLRVPGYTNLAGECTGNQQEQLIAENSAAKQQQQTMSGIAALRKAQEQSHFWASGSAGHDLSFTKEEDDPSMQMY